MEDSALSKIKFERPELKFAANLRREMALTDSKKNDFQKLLPDRNDPATEPTMRKGFLISEPVLTNKMNDVVLSRRAAKELAKNVVISNVKKKRAEELDKNEQVLLQQCFLVLEELLRDIQANSNLTGQWLKWWLNYTRLKHGAAKSENFSRLLEEFLEKSSEYIEKQVTSE